jgi:hypothetical protein
VSCNFHRGGQCTRWHVERRLTAASHVRWVGRSSLFGRVGALQLILEFVFAERMGASMGCEDAYEVCGVRRCTQWAGVGAVLVGLTAAASATVVAGGMQVATVPSAVASTTDATPWVPRPNTLPPFFPDMSSQVSSQGTVRSPQGSDPVLDWVAKGSDAGQDIQSAVQTVQGAVGAGDVAGAKAACQQMSDAIKRLNATLPTPVPALTSEVRDVVDEIGAASSVCLKAGPDAGQAEIDSFTSHVNAAIAHFTRAQEIAAREAGPRPRPGLAN